MSLVSLFASHVIQLDPLGGVAQHLLLPAMVLLLSGLVRLETLSSSLVTAIAERNVDPDLRLPSLLHISPPGPQSSFTLPLPLQT
ncbi:hypothetical protein K505DRAFT_156315 [Melanomma pulvis-pyrius CBS 109.77]|uniref:Uncharacterized protein n=1 Tax=Melanomma pulvis-pyrius CBS 109.77 TaxID=1314802 RepID=A0A6A6WPG6_9PLEO|nr:hypothetical protein K505DRAFT_156315 [Melanomma pulvis-pyrius CBS 109.77]